MDEHVDSATPDPPLGVLRREWRDRLLRRLSFLVAAAGTATIVAFLGTSFSGPTVWSFAPLVLVVLATLAFPSLPYRLRASTVVLALFLACLLPMLTQGFLPNILGGLLAVCLLATLLLGHRAGIAASALSVATILLLGLYFSSPASRLDPSWAQGFDPTRISNGVRIALMFLVVSSLAIASVSSILDRAEELLVERSRALEALRRESRERAAVQAELERREAAFRKAEEVALLGRMASFAAHDFSNALFLIQASTELARSEVGATPELLEHLDQIEAGVEQATATVRQLRGFGGADSPERQRLRLNDFMNRTVHLLRSILPTTIEIQTEPAPTPAIEADPGELLRILTNLALNARDAMREGGSLRIGWSKKNESEVLLTLADSGPGMDRETRERIFEPFFTTKGSEGTGLGLASVLESVTANGGSIEVETQEGQGSRFAITWPAALGDGEEGSPEVDRPRSPSAPSPSKENRPRGLVADDEETIRRSLRRLLHRFGFEVEEAGTTEEAIESVATDGPFDLLVTDCSMPGPPVRDLVAIFRSAFPAARIVLSTGMSRDEIADVVDRVDFYLAKPFTPEELHHAVTGVESG